MHITYRPITSATQDVVKTACWSSNGASRGRKGEKVTLNLVLVVSISETSDQLGHGSILPRINCPGCWWWCNCVQDIFWAHFGPLSTNWALFKMPQPTQVLLLNMPILRWTQYEHNLLYSTIMHHVTKLKSSQTSFLNIMRSLHSDGLHSHQISNWSCTF